MSQPVQDAAGSLFPRMDGKAREIVERRFRIRLDDARQTEDQQAAWDLYQDTVFKIAQAIDGGVEIVDPDGYAAALARRACTGYWLAQSPGWYEIKGRLFRFFRKQSGWEHWTESGVTGYVCGPAGWRGRPRASGGRIAALLDKPRLVASRALPKAGAFGELTVIEWDRWLKGIFAFLEGPVRLDELASIAGALYGVKGVHQLASDDLTPAEGEKDPRGWEPRARPANTLDSGALRRQIDRIWAEVQAMPRRWQVPFLLTTDIFVASGLATIAEIASLAGLSDEQYAILWTELEIEARGGPAISGVPDPVSRFSAIRGFLPFTGILIARVLGLEGPQPVHYLRKSATLHLAKGLRSPGNPAANGPPQPKRKSGHLSHKRLSQYRDRDLTFRVMAAADLHLAKCRKCREALAALARSGPAVALLAEIDAASSEHLTCGQMDAWVEQEMHPAERELAAAHVEICGSCHHQLRAYESAAPVMGAPVPKTRPVKSSDSGYRHVRIPARPEVTGMQKIKAFFRSPQLVLMFAAGVALVIGAPYLALQTLPDAGEEEAGGGAGAQLDLTELAQLPESLASSAQLVLLAEEPELPEVLWDVPPPLGIAQVYPVTEVIEATRPSLTWQESVPPPYIVEIRDAANHPVVRVPNIRNPVVVVPVPLERGAIYTWRLTTSDGAYEEASFRVMEEDQLELWQDVGRQYGDSHLALGLLAQYFGLLSVAQREYEQVLAANPDSEQAAILLDNVIALRE